MPRPKRNSTAKIMQGLKAPSAKAKTAQAKGAAKVAPKAPAPKSALSLALSAAAQERIQTAADLVKRLNKTIGDPKAKQFVVAQSGINPRIARVDPKLAQNPPTVKKLERFHAHHQTQDQRSYTEDRKVQALRHIATIVNQYLLKFGINAEEIQVGIFNEELYIAGNTKQANDKLVEVFGGVLERTAIEILKEKILPKVHERLFREADDFEEDDPLTAAAAGGSKSAAAAAAAAGSASGNTRKRGRGGPIASANSKGKSTVDQSIEKTLSAEIIAKNRAMRHYMKFFERYILEDKETILDVDIVNALTKPMIVAHEGEYGLHAERRIFHQITGHTRHKSQEETGGAAAAAGSASAAAAAAAAGGKAEADDLSQIFAGEGLIVAGLKRPCVICKAAIFPPGHERRTGLFWISGAAIIEFDLESQEDLDAVIAVTASGTFISRTRGDKVSYGDDTDSDSDPDIKRSKAAFESSRAAVIAIQGSDETPLPTDEEPDAKPSPLKRSRMVAPDADASAEGDSAAGRSDSESESEGDVDMDNPEECSSSKCARR